MMLLKKLYNNIKFRTSNLPTISLCYPKVKVEANTNRPYFVIGAIYNYRGETTKKLYIDDLKASLSYYKRQFSCDDWALIQYNLGGIESLQLYGTYQIISYDFENLNINIRNRSNMQEETWNVTTAILDKKYLNLDKQSILELGIFYQKIKNSNIIQTKIKNNVERSMKDALYIDKFDEEYINSKNNLRLVK